MDMKALYVLFVFYFISRDASAQIYGYVVREDGTEAVYERLTLSQNDAIVYRTMSNHEGRYTIDCLSPGIYKVLVHNYDHEDFETSVRITDDETINLARIVIPDQSKYEIIGCDFGCEFSRIVLDPFGGPTIIEAEDIRQRY
jgi:hypothetical protein